MSYSVPGVTVSQEFTELKPALGPYKLPNTTVGPAFQIVASDALGSYAGSSADYAYKSLVSGNIVDLRPKDSALLDSEQMPVSVVLTNISMEFKTTQATGYVNATNLLEFKDDTAGVFSDALAGDVIVISSQSTQVIPLGTAARTSANSVIALSGGIVGTSITFTANTIGVAGNSISLVFDALKTLQQVISTWNDANPTNLVNQAGGDLAAVYQAGTVTLVGGTITLPAASTVVLSSHAQGTTTFDARATTTTAYSSVAQQPVTYDTVAFNTAVYSTFATATYTGVNFKATVLGTIGNAITLTFDGILDLTTVVATWNGANPGNTVSHDGTGTDVLPLQSVVLSGGSANVPFVLKAVASGPGGNTLAVIFDGTATIDAAIAAQHPGAIVHNGIGAGVVAAQTITLGDGATGLINTLTAQTPGAIGNTIAFSSGGAFTTLASDIATWNGANAANQVAGSLAGSHIISALANFSLSGGTANSSNAVFTATTVGASGNSIGLVFDGIQTLDQVVATWNNANPSNTVTHTGQGIGVKTAATTIFLSGGGIGLPARFVAVTPGTTGNGIHLYFNGVDTTGAVVAAWNGSNPGNTIALSAETPPTVVLPGSLKTLLSGTNGQFSSVIVGNTVRIQSGTDVILGDYLVSRKISNDALELSNNFYTGTILVSNVGFGVFQVTSQPVPNDFIVRSVKDANTLILQREYSGSAGTGISYTMRRALAMATLVRDVDFIPAEDKITLNANILVSGNRVMSANVSANYRALDPSKADRVREYEDAAALEAEFGVGQLVPENPLPFGMLVSMQNSANVAQGIGLGADYYTNEVLAYAKALDIISRDDSYIITPLTHSAAVASILKTHVVSLSDEGRGMERAGTISKKLVTIETLVDSSTTAGKTIIVNTITNGAVVNLANTLGAATALFTDVQVGDKVVITAGTGVLPGTYTVSSVVSTSSLVLASFIATATANDVQYYIERNNGLEADGITFVDTSATFLTEGVTVGHYMLIEAEPSMPTAPVIAIKGRHKITAILSETKLRLEQIPGITSVQGGITYSLEKDMDRNEQADFIGAYAQSVGSRRTLLMWPDVAYVLKGSVEVPVPGYFLGNTVGGLTTGLPPQRGFTNTSVSGITRLLHSTDYFNGAQLDKMADKGTMIFVQPVPGTLPYIRHELTTDRSSVKFQEYMVTKNVDFSAKLMQDYFKSFSGMYNIVDSTYDELKSVSGAMIVHLRDETFIKGLGGIIKSGRLVSMEEGSSIDRIKIRFKFDYPIPLNNIDIVIEA